VAGRKPFVRCGDAIDVARDRERFNRHAPRFS
jgi:hypothetical protein